MSKTVLIGCKLPHGITLSGPNGEDIKINGMNTSLVAGGFGLTHVSEDIAAYLGAVYEDHSAFQSKALFPVASNKVADAVAMARELADERTGFEGLNPEAPAPGMEAADPKQVDQLKAAAEAQPRPAIAPAAPADKAAAKEAAGKA